MPFSCKFSVTFANIFLGSVTWEAQDFITVHISTIYIYKLILDRSIDFISIKIQR